MMIGNSDNNNYDDRCYCYVCIIYKVMMIVIIVAVVILNYDGMMIK